MSDKLAAGKPAGQLSLLAQKLTLLSRPAPLDCQSRRHCMSIKLFSELGLSPEILKAIEKLGFEKPRRSRPRPFPF